MTPGHSKIYFLGPADERSEEYADAISRLRRRCEAAMTDDPTAAHYVVGLGDPSKWPATPDALAGALVVYVLFEHFASLDAYGSVVDKLPQAVFLHGREGVSELIRLLERNEVIDAEEQIDPLAEDVFFRLKGGYLHQLEQELMDWKSNSAGEGGGIRGMLERVAGSAGTFEFEQLSSMAIEALAEWEAGAPVPAREGELVRDLGEALSDELEQYNQKVEAFLPALIELDVRQRVLVLADDPQIANQMKFALSHSRMQTVLHTNPGEILDALHAIQPDLLVVQQTMSHFDGLDLSSYIRHLDRFEALPILALLSDPSDATVSRAIRCGVDAWLSIPVSAANVALCVLNLLRRVETARKLGGRDALTGLYTKEALLDRLQGDLNRVSRAGQQIALVLVRVTSSSSPRLDFLEITELAKRVFRRSDLMARYNEATLAVVLPGIDARTIVTVISRFRQMMGDAVRFEIVATLADGNATPEALTADAEIRLVQVLGGKAEAAVGVLQKDRAEKKRTRAVPRVLIADTDEAIVNLLRFFCAREGFKVDDVRNGTDTVDYLERADQEDRLPEVLVLEAFLPGMDGFQILEKVQADYGNRVAVIMLSVRPSEERVAKAFRMGATDFVAKPFRVPEIIARIKNGLVRTVAM
jgi:PleD family two-component response regulator